MEEKTYRNHLHKKLCKLFLHTKFIQPTFIRGEIIKHLELSEENVVIGKGTITEDSITIPLQVTFDDNKQEFMLTFSKRIEESKEIKIPKIVKADKKWWQFGEPSKKVIVEKKTTEQRGYWLLSSIN